METFRASGSAGNCYGPPFKADRIEGGVRGIGISDVEESRLSLSFSLFPLSRGFERVTPRSTFGIEVLKLRSLNSGCSGFSRFRTWR